jgi:hypothetical protein
MLSDRALGAAEMGAALSPFRDQLTSFADNPLKLLDQRSLCRLDLPFGHRDVEKLGSIHFRKLHLTSRLWRPFHHEGVANDRRPIVVAHERPGVDKLSALLLHRVQRDERPPWLDARFLLELPLGGFEQVPVRVWFTLWDGPRPFVLAFEEGTAGMGLKDRRPLRVSLARRLNWWPVSRLGEQKCVLWQHPPNVVMEVA